MTVAVPPPIMTRGVAQVLGELAQEIEVLGATLCSNGDFAATHMGELQAIDLIAQKLGSLSGLLQADCAATAIGEVQLDALRSRFSSLHDELAAHLSPSQEG